MAVKTPNSSASTLSFRRALDPVIGLYAAPTLVIASLFALLAAAALTGATRRRTGDSRHEAEAAWQDDAEARHVMLNTVDDGVITTDCSGRIRFLNAMAESLTGWSLNAARGLGLDQVFRVINGETGLRLGAGLERMPPDDDVRNLGNAAVLIACNGMERLISGSRAVIRDAHGNPAGLAWVFRDETAAHEARQALRRTQAQLRAVFQAAPIVLAVSRMADGALLDVNDAACALAGRERNELLGKPASALGLFAETDDLTDLMEHAARQGTVERREIRFTAPDGVLHWGLLSAKSFDIDGVSHGLIAFLDGAECGQANGALIDTARQHDDENMVRLNAAAMDSTPDGVLITDLTPSIVAVNRAYREITGYEEAEVLGRNPRILQSGRHGQAYYQAMWTTLLEKGHWQGEIWNRRKNGEVYPEWLTLSTVRNAAGEPTHYVAVFTDLSHIKRNEARLERLAHYDTLTDLPNRLLVISRLEHAMDRARRRNGRIAVLFIDLDRFKTVNDSLGHPAGDALLVGVAKRLTQRLRKEDTLGRLGGDEFLVIVEDLRNPDGARVVAQALLETLETRSFTLPGGQEVYIRASIGISLYPKDGATSADLIRNADAAMYQVKDSGRNAYGYYTTALTRAAAERLEMETRLRHALERGEFVLHYQPIVAVTDGRRIGAEALLRWQPPGQDIVLPARFIRIAEETGLIVPLGRWVLRETCRQAKAWLDAGLSLGHMTLNLSVRQFQQRNLERVVRSVLDETGLPPASLELEITERCLLEQGERLELSIKAIKAMGVRLSIDDFGTGHSSLAWLKRLPLDRLKIDYSFIRDIPDDPNDMAIASTVIAMAHTLGLMAVAEGVETEAQLAFLRQQGCDAYQGFLYCRPLPAQEFAARFLQKAN